MVQMPTTGVAMARRCRESVLASLWFAVAMSLLVAGAGCKNTNFLSTRDEVRIGRQASEEIDKEYRVETDTKDAARVRRIGERVLLHAEQRRDVPYTFKVIDAPVINAVSLPGGPVYVYRGLLYLAGSDDDAVACVIAHEIGHINARHAAKMISQELAANVGIAILVKGRDLQNIAGLATDILNLNYSREDEYEADRRGLSYAQKAGYDPRGMTRFFKLLQTTEKKGSGGPEFLRTHPVTRARIDRAERIIETQNYPYGQ